MKKLTSLLIFCLCFFNLAAQINHLDKKISIHLQDVPLEELIYQLGEEGGFQFSYNARIMDGHQSVSFEANERPVREVLDELLGSGYTYKIVGKHVIILEETAKTKQPRSERKREYVITGFIYDSRTGEKIHEASIYEAKDRIISATDQQGYYELIVPSGDQERYLSFSKVGYLDTVIIVRLEEKLEMDINLHPLPSGIEEMNKIEPVSFNMHQTPFVAALVPNKSVVMADNVQVVEERAAQISFLPFVGSNRFVSGMLTNHLSVNVLAGYSGGVKGLEIGGLLNMDRGDVKGVQIGGLGNIVGGQTDALQVGGLFNVTARKMNGWQLAGFTNIAIDTLRGAQMSGFANILRGGMYGPQISGFVNFTSQNVDGIQLSGFTNIAIKDVKLGQVSGFANYGRDIGGVQMAGFTNIATRTNRAIQVSGFLNYATDLHGVQIAPLNYADTVSAGVPFGVFSFVRRGFHPIEISIEELFWANLSFKTGVNAFYNIFSAGYSGDLAYAGYGIGSQFYIKKKFSPGIELHARAIGGLNNAITFQGLQNKLQLNFTYKFHKHFSLTTGPSINTIFFSSGFPVADDFVLPGIISLQKTSLGSVELPYWYGWSLGIRL